MLVAAPGFDRRKGRVYLVKSRDSYDSKESIAVEMHKDRRLIVKGSTKDGHLGRFMASGNLDGKGEADLVLAEPGAKVVHVILR